MVFVIPPHKWDQLAQRHLHSRSLEITTSVLGLYVKIGSE